MSIRVVSDPYVNASIDFAMISCIPGPYLNLSQTLFYFRFVCVLALTRGRRLNRDLSVHDPRF